MIQYTSLYSHNLHIYNTQLGDDYKEDGTSMLLGNKCLPLPMPHNWTSCDTVHISNNFLSPD